MLDFETKAQEIAKDPHLSKKDKSLLLSQIILEAQTDYDNRISQLDSEIAGIGARSQTSWLGSVFAAVFSSRARSERAERARAKTARARLVSRKHRLKVDKRSLMLKLRRIKTGVQFFK